MSKQLDMFQNVQVIKSIGWDQNQMLTDILELHDPFKPVTIDPRDYSFELDMTYGKGNFYRKLPKPRYCFDKFPRNKQIGELVFPLPFRDSSISSIMIDPPFVISSGPSLKNGNKSSNLISKHFSCYRTPNDLFSSYRDLLNEAHRLLRKDGLLVFKTQDQVSSSKQIFVHSWLINEACRIGLYPKDMFVLLSRNRILSSKHTNQKHSRKYHSYFLCFSKQEPKIKYDNVKTD